MADNVFIYLLKQLYKTFLVILDDLQNFVVEVVTVVCGVDYFFALLVECFGDLLSYSIIKWIALSLKLFEKFFFASRLFCSPSTGNDSSVAKPKSLKNTSPSCTSS